MATYRIVFVNNVGSFPVDAIATSVGGVWSNSVLRFDGKRDLAFIELPEENVEYLEELLEADENVVSFEEFQG